ncbi:multicopper oxidase family protein [Streptomyces sparsogenes]|uniref:Putative multicopper oxidase n=1 Tax=Streptomyces sparsogenes DSM 40356 TaxID=1331668 RepID=A0A1R1SI13_9ACTN|nr:multicopper oxidase family protein [Streptomyces sparsogenes]OMI37876.1 putative multicopper oxidase [Streptomyces sparsogenes DSM 40356]
MHAYTRRAVIGAGIGVAGGGLLASRAASSSASTASSASSASSTPSASGDPGGPASAVPPGYVSPDGEEVAAAERGRARGAVREIRLTATPSSLDLGDRTVRTWTYGDELPGRPIRVTAGDTLAVRLDNNLPRSTTLHWHGIALRNDMDGVPGVTQQPIRPGASFDYRFAVPDPGTYWFHPHSGVQLDRGLYAPLIVEDPREPLEYDHEWIVMLDDWVDGVDGSTPDAVLDELTGGRARMAGMDDSEGAQDAEDPEGADGGPAGPSRRLRGARSRLLEGDPGDVAYPYYLVNGRTPEDPRAFRAKPGDRIRIRLVNVGGDTPFRVALGGHTMTVTHTDGYPVEHTSTDALLLGMAERYDVLVTAQDGVFPLVALAEGKGGAAMALLRTSDGAAAPPPSVRPRELDGRLLTADRLKAAEDVRLTPRAPDRTVRLRMTGSMARYDWAINGKPYDPAQRYPVRAGERVRVSFINGTDMWHPMHLHGHTFQLPGGGPRKDTTIVLPHHKVDVEFDADNPGLWMVHCHNIYHSESGLMTIIGYRK